MSEETKAATRYLMLLEERDEMQRKLSQLNHDISDNERAICDVIQIMQSCVNSEEPIRVFSNDSVCIIVSWIEGEEPEIRLEPVEKLNE